MFANLYPDPLILFFDEYVKMYNNKLRRISKMLFYETSLAEVPIAKDIYASGDFLAIIESLIYETDVVTVSRPASSAPKKLYRRQDVTHARVIYELAPNEFKYTAYTFPLSGTLAIYTCSRCLGSGIIQERCPSCNGTGFRECPNCYGTGYVTQSYYDWEKQEFVEEKVLCRVCMGSGRVLCDKCCGRGFILETCPECRGEGRIAKWSELMIIYEVIPTAVYVGDKNVAEAKAKSKIKLAENISILNIPENKTNFISEALKRVEGDIRDRVLSLFNTAPKHLREVLLGFLIKVLDEYKKLIEKKDVLKIRIKSIFFYPKIRVTVSLYDVCQGKHAQDVKVMIIGSPKSPSIHVLGNALKTRKKLRLGNVVLTSIGLLMIGLSTYLFISGLTFVHFPVVLGILGLTTAFLIPYLRIRESLLESRILRVYVISQSVDDLINGISSLRSTRVRDFKVFVPEGFEEIIRLWSLPVMALVGRKWCLITFLRAHEFKDSFTPEKLSKLKKNADYVFILDRNSHNSSDKGIIVLSNPRDIGDAIMSTLYN